jgi:CheY-like chemotaxis protein
VDSEPLLVLVADDDEDLREALAQILVSDGLRVVLAADGQHALDQLAQGVAPCAILLDWMMPRVNGEAFLRARATSTFLSAMPVFVISATHLPEADHRIQGFLAKPFDVVDLLPMLRGVCGEHCPAPRRHACHALAAKKNGA